MLSALLVIQLFGIVIPPPYFPKEHQKERCGHYSVAALLHYFSWCASEYKEWELILPLISISYTDLPQKDVRAHLNGILWLARSGARWSDLPARFGPHQTVYSFFCRWRDDGTLKKIFELCAAPGTGTELSMDSTSIKASVQAGRGIRKRAKLRHQAASAKRAEG